MLTRQRLPKQPAIQIHPSTAIQIKINHELQLARQMTLITRKPRPHHPTPGQQPHRPVHMTRRHERHLQIILIPDMVPIKRHTLDQHHTGDMQRIRIQRPRRRLPLVAIRILPQTLAQRRIQAIRQPMRIPMHTLRIQTPPLGIIHEKIRPDAMHVDAHALAPRCRAKDLDEWDPGRQCSDRERGGAIRDRGAVGVCERGKGW